MTFLLDTNAFLLFGFESDRMPSHLRAVIATQDRFVSQVCAIEMAIKHSLGKLALPPSYSLSFERGFNDTVRQLAVTVLDIQLPHIASLARLPFHHRDPFDRLIIAQALTEDMTVVSRDREFGLYPGLSLLQI
ncbi:MAG TPA: type II toxin-antitoxin system VapC family toxin [Caulobacteraceae bacterium]|nr:type II toxin-antitoxin system VapC family toxin [Caulobacteraceae bacterium]